MSQPKKSIDGTTPLCCYCARFIRTENGKFIWHPKSFFADQTCPGSGKTPNQVSDESSFIDDHVTFGR